mmetsp:Transcript_71599/g.158326  ORF Transcript_71599/g.158326 Transcript_71599/m.158326 type:complete len:96 (-) Transcript_71599:40-327(-)
MMLKSGLGIEKPTSFSVSVSCAVARSEVWDERAPGWGTKATSENSKRTAPAPHAKRRAGRRALDLRTDTMAPECQLTVEDLLRRKVKATENPQRV